MLSALTTLANTICWPLQHPPCHTEQGKSKHNLDDECEEEDTKHGTGQRRPTAFCVPKGKGIEKVLRSGVTMRKDNGITHSLAEEAQHNAYDGNLGESQSLDDSVGMVEIDALVADAGEVARQDQGIVGID